MYTQLLKEIEHAENARQKFTDFCIDCFTENDLWSKALRQFDIYYEDHS
jgi:hypothetical protein